MLVHNVFFWLKSELTGEEREVFERGLQSLRGISAVREMFIGPPADTDRPVIDRSYSWALTVIFEDRAAHDRYQEDPLHDRFLEECSKYWDRVLIYDSVDGEK